MTTATPRRARLLVIQATRAVTIVIGHGSIPKPLRWLAAFGLLPIPGPFDEAVLLLVAVILAVFYRDRLRDAWAEGSPTAEPEARDPGPRPPA